MRGFFWEAMYSYPKIWKFFHTFFGIQAKSYGLHCFGIGGLFVHILSHCARGGTKNHN